MKEKSGSLWNDLMEWAYRRALTGSGGLDKASTLAMRFYHPSLTIDEQIDALVRRQKILAGSSGFLTGLGGIMSLPFTIPANLASVVFIQLRMIIAIAYLGGYDPEDEKVKTMAFACMAGNAAKDVVQEMSIQAGKRTTRKLLQRTGLANLGKAIPLAGGIIGGSIDVLATAIVARLARKTFIEKAV